MRGFVWSKDTKAKFGFNWLDKIMARFARVWYYDWTM